jgi:hypothetical protein
LLLFFAWLRANQKALFAATEGVDFFSALQHFSQVPFVVDRNSTCDSWPELLLSPPN